MGFAFWLFAAGCAISIASVAIGKPWTEALARKGTPPELRKTPLFHETNLLMTGLWALVFMVAAFAAARSPLWAHLAIAVALIALGRMSPQLGTWYANRRMATMGLDRRL